MKYSWVILALALGLLVVVTLLDALIRYTPAQIAGGQAFFYYSHVDVFYRPLALLVGVGLLGLWVVMRRVWRWVAWFTPLSMSLLALGCCVFSVITPLLSLQTSAFHLQTTRLNGVTFHLYYQNEPLPSRACDYVLVRCDGVGFVCEQVAQWQPSAICLGNRLPIALVVESNRLQVRLNDEIMTEITP